MLARFHELGLEWELRVGMKMERATQPGTQQEKTHWALLGDFGA